MNNKIPIGLVPGVHIKSKRENTEKLFNIYYFSDLNQNILSEVNLSWINNY